MAKVNCKDCFNWSEAPRCRKQFRWASDYHGKAVACHEDVWFCPEYVKKPREDDCHDKSIEIYFGDLTPEKQQELLDAWGDNGNYDIYPIAMLPVFTEE